MRTRKPKQKRNARKRDWKASLPDKIVQHLKKLDTLRDRIDEKTDKMFELMAKNVDLLMKNPKNFMKAISVEFLKEEKDLFSKARKEGKQLKKIL